MAITVSEGILYANPVPAQQWQRKLVSGITYADWSSFIELETFFTSTTGLDGSFMVNKYFWVAGYFYFFDGVSYLPVTSAPPANGVQGIPYRITVTGPSVTIPELEGMRLLTTLYANITYDTDSISLDPNTGVLDGSLVGGFEAGFLLTIMYQPL